MVQANELRIGNYISYKNERWIKVGYHEIRYAVLYPDTSYYPSPLTPEILGKAGFRNISDLSTNMYTSFWNDIVGQISGYHNGYFFKDSVCNDINVLPINYVHQLQNLYFALTGEELEVNLSVVVARGTI